MQNCCCKGKPWYRVLIMVRRAEVEGPCLSMHHWHPNSDCSLGTYALFDAGLHQPALVCRGACMAPFAASGI